MTDQTPCGPAGDGFEVDLDVLIFLYTPKPRRVPDGRPVSLPWPPAVRAARNALVEAMCREHGLERLPVIDVHAPEDEP